MNSEPTSAKLSLHSPGATLELKLMGRLTSGDIPEVHEAAREIAASNRDLVVCCEQVEFLGSGVLQSLIALANALGGQGKKLRFVGIQPDLERWLFLAGLA
jgi:anti-anti-sigma factor